MISLVYSYFYIEILLFWGPELCDSFTPDYGSMSQESKHCNKLEQHFTFTFLTTSFTLLPGETKMIEKLNALTDEAQEDDDEIAEMYSAIKRRISAPAGLTKTLYNLYCNRKYYC